MDSGKIDSIEKMFLYMFTAAIDLACMAICWIPGIDLLGWPLKMFGLISLNLYFFIRVGPKYIGGKRSAQKMANVIVNGVVNVAPGLDDFIPALTIQLGTTYYLLDQDAKGEEKESAAKAANDNVRRPPLSRAA
ncbi:MAG: hypothetical protein JWM39_122 [Parcubacteria group bacterium]|nr:hypothetical protein [Parcubacteria group bacterium]